MKPYAPGVRPTVSPSIRPEDDMPGRTVQVRVAACKRARHATKPDSKMRNGAPFRAATPRTAGNLASRAQSPTYHILLQAMEYLAASARQPYRTPSLREHDPHTHTNRLGSILAAPHCHTRQGCLTFVSAVARHVDGASIDGSAATKAARDKRRKKQRCRSSHRGLAGFRAWCFLALLFFNVSFSCGRRPAEGLPACSVARRRRAPLSKPASLQRNLERRDFFGGLPSVHVCCCGHCCATCTISGLKWLLRKAGDAVTTSAMHWL